MSIRRTIFRVLFVALALAVGLAGCSSPLSSLSGPAAPCSVAVSKQAADNLVNKINAARLQRNQATITVTSQELTSILVQSLQQAQAKDPKVVIPLQNPVICFRNGLMSVFGTISAQGMGNVSALLTMSAVVTNGQTSFHVEQMQFGQFSAPQALGDSVASLVADALNQQMAQFRLTAIQIGNDQMTVSAISQ